MRVRARFSEIAIPSLSSRRFTVAAGCLIPSSVNVFPKTQISLRFRKKYTLYAGKTDGKAVFNFVFKMQSEEYKDLPEDTTLQRALKKLYLDGKYIYELSGIIVC